MCSIMGYCSRSAAFDVFMEGFNRTISRGPDDSRIVETRDGLLGFHRLSIMGLAPICTNFAKSVEVVVGRFFVSQYMTFLSVPILQRISSEYLALSS